MCNFLLKNLLIATMLKKKYSNSKGIIKAFAFFLDIIPMAFSFGKISFILL